ncbi:hypothetical protein DFH08DRAFT_804354 [Mycena albidolilacea]|uniref:Uncharacterized protein n=1 Tax=Mycena albidolilacea TaxID=1033008 RepID=A0AAD7EW74_9AGAR|nr:hypothetical protein DFH08DRAFT_804354 [Mycena albidolilacea]
MSGPAPSRHNPTARRTVNIPTTLLLSGISFLGAFSRLTAGQYTPQWYAYQLERAGNTAGTTQSWLIPAMDIAFGTLLLSRRTRRTAAAAITTIFAIGLTMRVSAGKGFVPDAALVGLAVVVLGTS